MENVLFFRQILSIIYKDQMGEFALAYWGLKC